MFQKILIANRGEIACRIIRTCRRLGISTVAVYSDADADALHVRQADVAYRLGPLAAAESYLHIPRIMKAVADSGAQAVHPGYGFLSQSPKFAQACTDAGVTFIGPDQKVMESMGDKVLARNLAREAGLNLIPGTESDVADEEALRLAPEIGFPLMVKATEGGGGIGVRPAYTLEMLRDVLVQSRVLAQGAFGSSRVYLERVVERAAHVEVQVLADTHGNAVHLFDRDCSVQRRNQKVVEETPCIKIGDEQRRELYDAALALVRHIGYTNAGTVEFLVSKDGEAYFLEMNTRLQVEHGVTELVTGLDLVELQLRVAAGESLPFRQEDIVSRGHAIEARVYSEDPETCLPAVGLLTNVEEPSGPQVRVDSGICTGFEVTPHYDPMLAKVMAWGASRGEATARLQDALAAYLIEGTKTNIPTVRAVLAEPAFICGEYDTTWFTEVLPRLGQQAIGDSDSDLAAAIAVAIALAREIGEQQRRNPWKEYGRRQEFNRQQVDPLRPWPLR
jgi:acetyl-CoA carboxylase biotin carboxylase subunit